MEAPSFAHMQFTDNLGHVPGWPRDPSAFVKKEPLPSRGRREEAKGKKIKDPAEQEDCSCVRRCTVLQKTATV